MYYNKITESEHTFVFLYVFLKKIKNREKHKRKEKKKMANRSYKYYQPNQKDIKDKYGDCSIRALTKYFDKEWIEIFNDLIVYAQKNQCMPNMLPNIQEYLEDQKVPFARTYKPKARHKETVLDFAKSHKEGKFIIYCRVGYGTHLVAVENGIYYDTWDCGDRIVYGYWGNA